MLEVSEKFVRTAFFRSFLTLKTSKTTFYADITVRNRKQHDLFHQFLSFTEKGGGMPPPMPLILREWEHSIIAQF